MELDQDITQKVLAGDEIGAIKLYRERHGGSMEQAMEAIAAVRDAVADLRPAGGGPGGASGGGSGSGWGDDVDELIRSRKKIEAIKLVRERASMGLKDAKDAVERRAVELGVQQTASKCFIATAAYGSGRADEVATLRRYRNRVLRKSVGGRVFVGAYEAVSPPIARVVARSGLLRVVVRSGLGPVARWAGRRTPR
ncbi:MAG: ribosomal protein L7/L12 [Phycisphaerales bacterium]|jgi:ribosomal protein L7/L12|nr:ribosomal protein L7/L12 [Phycisphaerales bacterium]